jgi:hypothetical protein
MGRACRLLLAVFLLLYLVALGLLAVGTFGLLGSERDPLAGVFLMPLGLPWNLLLGGFPEPLRPWLAAAAPAVNLLALWLTCRALHRHRRATGDTQQGKGRGAW